MASPIALPPAFDGMVQDFPRNNLPKGRAWNLVDFIPEALGAPLTERGGWSYASQSLTAADVSATYVAAGIYAPFTGGSQLLVVDDHGDLLKITSLTATTDVGAIGVPLQNPVMHRQSVIVPSPDGSTLPNLYNGTTISSLTAAPAARYMTVFVDRTVAASTTAQPQRVYFSAAGDPTTWSLTGTSASYIDVSFEVKALASLPNVILVFGKDRTARIRGTTPPPGTDMSLDDPIFQLGVADARSVAVNGPLAGFANTQGVYLSTGTNAPEDLTAQTGVKKYWRDLLTGSWDRISGGWYGNVYVVTVMNSTTFVDSFAFDVSRKTAYRFSNLKAGCLFAAGQAGQELYLGQRTAAYLTSLSSMWSPSSSVKNDADGTAVTGIWETPYYTPSNIGGQRWREVYLQHDLRDAASDSPTWTISYCTSPESGAAYTALTPTIAATTAQSRARRWIHRKSTGLGFKLTRQNASAQARVYMLGATVYSREGSRLDA